MFGKFGRKDSAGGPDTQSGAPVFDARLGALDFQKMLSEHINDGVVVQDIEGRILWANEAYQRITGYAAHEVLGRKPQEFILPEDQQISAREIADFRYDPAKDLFQGFEVVQNRRKSGELFWAQLSFGFFQSPEGDHVIVSVRDVSEQMAQKDALRQSKRDLEQAVYYDALTGLANRRKLADFLADSLQQAAECGSRIALMHVDLDHFKEVNDTHGHAAGDAVIKYAADTLNRRAGNQGMAARIGGDEFIMVRPDICEAQPIQHVAETLISDTKDPLLWEDRQLIFGYSIGLALSEPGMTSGQELIQNADFALYESKAKGRGCWSFYDTDLRKKHRTRKGMAEDLVRTIRDRGIEFYYQPIIELDSGRVRGIETLARWNHPDKGNIPPGEFLSIASELSILDQLDVSAMKAAALALNRIERLGYTDTYVSFNASTHTLSGTDLAEDMVWTAAELQVDPAKLAIEVLETVFFASDATETKVAAQIRQMRDAGFVAMLDDFGMGYAGLAHLGQLDVTGLKIDDSLIRKVSSDRAAGKIVSAILRLAKDLGKIVVAEGVEDEDARQFLIQNGCALAQGFYFAHPMPLEQLEDWLIAHAGDQSGRAYA